MIEMNELNILLKQKKEIELRILELKQGAVCITPRMIFKENEKAESELRYQVAAKGVYIHRRYNTTAPYELKEEVKNGRWYPFIREETPEKALETLKAIEKEIPEMIEKIENYIKIAQEKKA